MIASHVIVLFVTFGHLSSGKTGKIFLETSNEGCTNQSFSSDIEKPSTPMLFSFSNHQPIVINRWAQNFTTTTAAPKTDEGFVDGVFAVSYMYYAFFGTAITVLVGMLVSLLTQSDADAYDSKYIHPCVYKITKYIPGYGHLFSDERQTIQIKNTTLKESQDIQVQPQDNLAFDMKSEQIEDNSSQLFKSNIIYKAELCAKPSTSENENYKKLEEV